MKALLDFRIARLEQQEDCPCCGTYRQEFCRNPEYFPDGDEDYLFAQGDYAAARYECGSEFAVKDNEEIRANQPCGQPSIDAADEMQTEADEACDDAEEGNVAA